MIPFFVKSHKKRVEIKIWNPYKNVEIGVYSFYLK